MVSKWSDNTLNDIWSSLLDIQICKTINEEDLETQGILMLLEITMTGIKKLSNRLVRAEAVYKSAVTEQEQLKAANRQLSEQLEELKVAPCATCPVLQKQLSEQKRKVSTTDARIKKIARILNLADGGSQASTQGCHNGNDAYTLMTQLLGPEQLPAEESPPKPAKRKSDPMELVEQARKKKNSSQEKGNCAERIVEPELLAPIAICEPRLVIPETQYSEPTTPEKQDVAGLAEDNRQISPILSRVSKILFPRNAAAEVKEFMLPKQLSKKNSLKLGNERVKISQSVLCDKWNTASSVSDIVPHFEEETRQDVSILKNRLAKKREPSEIDSNTDLAILLSREAALRTEVEVRRECDDHRKRNSKKGSSQEVASKEKKADFWQLKPSREMERSGKLKQMKLSLGRRAEKVNLVELRGEEEEVVPCSPRQTSKGSVERGRPWFQKGCTQPGCLDETMFAPMAASTCQHTDEPLLETSFDRVPGRENLSPDFVYKQGPVRNRDQRKNLQGWDCDNCAKYYEVAGDGLSPDQLRAHMDACSRHRSKYAPKAKTPPGFWDPAFPDLSSPPSDAS